jgi:hypothetical protein
MNDTPRSFPPHFVPTLTEVVRPVHVATPMALPAEFVSLLDGWPAGAKTPQPASPDVARLHVEGLAPAMVERILLRVELSLASRLQETIDSVVDAQMDSLKVALRTQINAAVLEAVTQAAQQETELPQPSS